MNDSKNSSNGLLVLRYPCDLSQETANKLTEYLSPTAEALGVEPLVIGNGGDVKIIESGYDILLTRLCVAVERLVAQGEPPEGLVNSEAQIAPQALNARPTGLNERPVCKGAWELGTACGKCERCKANRPSPPPAPPMRVGG